MRTQQRVVEEILGQAGVQINGPNPWDIQVKDPRFYPRILRHKNLGLGESYMDGWWECPRLDEFIHRILVARLEKKVAGRPGLWLKLLPALIFNLQTRKGSCTVAERHYNLDQRLFMSFLDPYNQYSGGYFKDTDDLTLAQKRKMELICRKIDLRAEDHLLEIGFGWGGFSRFAAENYRCKVTAVNISREQWRYAQDFCKDLPVRLLLRDYRDIRGQFDKIVSVGMFEHVGQKNYREFMRTVARCLKPGGAFLLQTIGGNESQVDVDPWIGKYIFPNSMLPSLSQIGKAAEGLLVIEDLHNLGPHYDKTLMAWNRNFQKAWSSLNARNGERFKRMWEYYLLSCAGAFRSRSIQLWQLVFTPYGTSQPNCRF